MNASGTPEAPAAEPHRSVGQRIYKQLFKIFGPAQLGDYHAPSNPKAIVEVPCSQCGRPYTEHTVERTPEISRMRCPSPDEIAASAAS